MPAQGEDAGAVLFENGADASCGPVQPPPLPPQADALTLDALAIVLQNRPDECWRVRRTCRELWNDEELLCATVNVRVGPQRRSPLHYAPLWGLRERERAPDASSSSAASAASAAEDLLARRTRQLLRAGARVNTADVSAWTAVTHAVACGNVPSLLSLLGEGGDADACSKPEGGRFHRHLVEPGKHPMAIACERNDGACVAALVTEGGVDPNKPCASSFPPTPLAIAAVEDAPDAITALLSLGADPDVIISVGFTALTYACECGNTKAVRALLMHPDATCRADPNVRDPTGSGPLLAASRNAYSDIVKLLVEAGADPMCWLVRIGGATPLIFAAIHDDVESCAALLSSPRVDVNKSMDMDGMGPLWVAAQCGHARIVKLLLDAGADPDGTDIRGDPPLVAAARALRGGQLAYNQGAGTGFPLKARGPQRSCDGHGRRAGLSAPSDAHRDYPATVLHLLQAGADPDARGLDFLPALDIIAPPRPVIGLAGRDTARGGIRPRDAAARRVPLPGEGDGRGRGRECGEAPSEAPPSSSSPPVPAEVTVRDGMGNVLVFVRALDPKDLPRHVARVLARMDPNAAGEGKGSLPDRCGVAERDAMERSLRLFGAQGNAWCEEGKAAPYKGGGAGGADGDADAEEGARYREIFAGDWPAEVMARNRGWRGV